MRYVSTRGSAPELGFADTLLTGLATDGGLYVPAEWPRLPVLDPEAGYAANAAAVMAPYAGEDVPPARAGRRVRGGLRDVPPSRRVPARPDRGRRVAARAVPRTHAGLQGHGAPGGGPAVRPRAGSAGRTGDDRRSHQRRHRQRGDRRRGRAAQRRHRDALPAGPGQRGPAPADDDQRRAQRPRRGGRGDVRRLPGPREGHVQRLGLPATPPALRGELHQLGPRDGPDRLLRNNSGAPR